MGPHPKEMLRQSDLHASVRMNKTHWWISGGYLQSDTIMSEIYNHETKKFTSYVDLPEGMLLHHMLKMNETRTHYILCQLNQNYPFEEVTEKWVNLPGTDFQHETGFCGLTTKDGTQELAVTAGPDNSKTEIFNFGSWTWRLGKDLPEESRHSGRSAQYGKSFLVIGGEDRDSVFYFNPRTYAWDLLPHSAFDIIRHPDTGAVSFKWRRRRHLATGRAN